MFPVLLHILSPAFFIHTGGKNTIALMQNRKENAILNCYV